MPMVRYDKFWVTLRERGMTQYTLTSKYSVSKSMIDRIRRNEGLNVDTIDKFCNLLQCEVSDIMEHVKDDNSFGMPDNKNK